jgi:hypothetical protein
VPDRMSRSVGAVQGYHASDAMPQTNLDLDLMLRVERWRWL